ncbi:hypothetical protein [Flagellimonas sp. S3867]|uniref:hypothetical protein n=1 Tax=Flagellimonas sp. S3867 TaxID=2768063 RepID=UPI001683DF53|nr:hypothetical protein [Flagellimonas sp. S3867]
MKKILIFGILLCLFSCEKKEVSKEDLPYLNGYWEISEVSFPDGTKKNYTVNPTIDFIHLENNHGFRKKMQPKFDGSYKTSKKQESFKVVEAQQTFILRYENNLSEWEEKLIRLDSTSFAVQNNEGVLYAYKRFHPIVIPK